jgi:hypothetical protein
MKKLGNSIRRNQRRRYSVVLFLDFDGVLHPSMNTEGNYFCCMPLLATVLQEVPNVGVIISSSWRHHHDIDELLDFFPEQLRHRVIGTTRSVLDSRARNRHEEIVDYLHISNEARPYVALDDSRIEFPRGFKHAHFCDPRTGLKHSDVLELVKRLKNLPCVTGGRIGAENLS